MAEGDNNNTGGPTADELQARIDKGNELFEQLQKINKQYSTQEQLADALKNANEALSEAQKKGNTSAINNAQAYVDMLKQAQEQTEAFEKAEKDLTENFVSQEKAVQALGAQFGSFGSVVVGVYSELDKFNKKQEELAKLQEKGLISKKELDKLSQFTDKAKTLSIASMALAPISGMFDNLLSRMVEFATAQFNAEQNMQKLFLTTEETAESFSTLDSRAVAGSFAVKELGIESGKLQETFITLSGEFSGLRDQINSGQMDFVAQAAVLERIGVAAKDSGASLNTLNRVFKQSTAQTADFVANLNAIGVAQGLGPGELVSTFNELSPQILKIGKGTSDLTKTMSNLAYASRQSGIEMGRIVDFAAGFDTFEGAADRVGKLNAILGGDYLNVMDLMASEDPVERMKLVTDAITEQGRTFQDLAYYEKLALTEAGNFKDVGELALAMSGNFDLMQNGISQTQDTYIDAAKRAKEFQEVQESLQSTLVAIAKTPGFNDAVVGGIEMFVDFMKFMANNGGAVITFLALNKAATIALAVAQFKLAFATKVANKEMGGGAGGVPSPGLSAGKKGLLGAVLALGFVMFMMTFASNLLDGIGKFSMAILAMGVAARIGGKNINTNLVLAMLALGLALGMALKGIGVAAEGIASMADSVSNLNAEQLAGFNTALIGLVGTLALFTVGIVALGLFATGPQMLGILGIGAAFLMIGAGIGVAAAGMGVFAEGVGAVVGAVGSLVESMATGIATMTDSFIKLFDSGVGGGALIGMAAGLYAMAASLVGFSAALAILTPAVLIFQGITSFGKLLGGGPETGDMESFTGMVESLASINPENLTKTVEQVSNLRKEMSNMMESPDMIKDFTDMLKVFERDMQLAATINMQEKEQKAELTITSPITIKVDDNTQLIGKIDERVLAKLNFTRS